MDGEHKLETRNSGEDDKWRQTKLPTTRNQRNKKRILNGKTRQRFSMKQDNTSKNAKRRDKRALKKTKKKGIFIDTKKADKGTIIELADSLRELKKGGRTR